MRIHSRTLRWLLLHGTAALICASASGVETTLIPTGSVWSYDTGTDLGTVWRESAYPAESTWSAGPGILGFGETYVNTQIPFGPNASNKYPTAYFRIHFNVANPGAALAILLRANFDDSFAAYLNGQEVARQLLSVSATYNDLSLGQHEGGGYETFDATVGLPFLVAGDNVLAVEVHQSTLSSSDLVWDCELAVGDQAAVLSRGPYLMVGTPHSMVVRWRSSTATDTRVRWGTDPGNLNDMAENPTPTAEHEIEIGPLTSDTRYYYSIGSTQSELASGAEFNFRTAPIVGTQAPLRVWAIGDSGTKNANAADVRDGYLAFTGTTETDVWLMLGDNAYGTGTDIEYQAAVFDMYPTFLRTCPLWPTRGNHDVLHSGADNDYYELFTMPTLGEAGGLASGTEAYYSFDSANVHFVCLDSEGTSRLPAGAMLSWLTNDLAATDQHWIVAYWHHPPYTKGSHDSDNTSDSGGRMRDMRENALPILEQGGVDLVLSGHSHSYERSFLMDGHYGISSTLQPSMILDGGDGQTEGDGAYEKMALSPTAHEGSVYIVAGSSGQISGGLLNHPVMFSSQNRLGTMVLDFDARQLDARFIDDTGAVLDYFTMVKGTAVATPEDLGSSLRLQAGAPNPFAHRTRIAYSLPKTGPVRIALYDARGRLVRTLVDEIQNVGDHEVHWEGRDAGDRAVSVGIYYVVMQFSDQNRTRKLVLAN